MKTKNQIKTIITIAMAALSVACTEERPYEKIFKDSTSAEAPQAKSKLSTVADANGGDEYLYVPSAVNNTRTTDATFPGYMGEAKIVKLKFTEGSLQVLEVDADRFGNNPVNAKPVLEIPISHIDYKCSKDADGKCTNKEEENNDVRWDQKRSFKLNAAALNVMEVNYLPIEITNLFYPCYNEVGSNVADVSIDQDSINIQVEKQYRSRLECAEIKSLSDLTFRVRNHYSLVKLKAITTPTYKTMLYPRAEEGMFGFFTTETLKLDQDNNENEQSRTLFVNRWATNKTLTYHLTENFNKPENKKIKEMTLRGIDNINKTLTKAGANIQIALSDKTITDKETGNLKYSSILLVEDPISYPLLGYGPTAANPRTGEIVQGRTAMYLGVLRQVVKNAYDDFVLEKIEKSRSAQSSVATETNGSGDLVTVGDENGEFSLSDELKKFTGSRARPDIEKYMETKNKSRGNTTVSSVVAHDGHDHSVSTRATKGSNSSIANGKKPLPSIETLTKYATQLNARKIQLGHIARMDEDQSVKETVMSLHCYYTAEASEISASLEDSIDEVIQEVGLKPWNSLSDAEKTKVMDSVLPVVYLSTLIHEIGHNLGLRHNFGGSEDKANFYTEKELAEMGINKAIPYSTVMEYSYKHTNDLRVMGKYDIAALRYGYAEQVELENGNFISVADLRATPTAKAKAYKYCTDEHASVNPNCQRFDEGTNLVEITTHLINSYEQNYFRRNFRNNRLSFSLSDDLAYASRIRGTMMGVRAMLERYEDIKQTFGLEDNNPVWEQIEFLKDLKTASRMAGNFLMRVVNTPDTMCAVAAKKAPNSIIAVVPIRVVSNDAISCFDKENVQLNPQYVVVGEAGKSFQSRKDPNSRNPYIDQIDVRGVWMDKLLATKALTGRITGIESYDEFTGNFLDITDMRETVQTNLSSLLLDEVVTEVPIRTASGQVLVAELPVSMFDVAEGQHPHRIPKHIFSSVRRAFNLPNTNTDYLAEVSQLLKRELPSREQISDATSLLNAVLVSTALPGGADATEFITSRIGLSTLFVNSKSEVAATQMVSREIVLVLKSLSEEKLAEILEKVVAGENLPDSATENEKLAYSLGADVLMRFLQGGFKSPIFYEHMLISLAK
jgi:hypothetical protein